jgi:serine/threonine-protein kinase
MVAPLGRGGMGEVWRADDLALGQPVALKFLPAHLADDPDRLARFRKEVALARHVSHPNCCRVFDLAEHDGRPFLTMEFIDGEDLAGLLRRVGRLSEEKAVEVARQLCAALAAVHEQGLLHRDLKPANVMLDGRGKVRLADFGLADAAADLSASGVRAGTPQYMAPEQLAGKEVTQRSDLFSLGMVLYELFTGKRAFAGTDRETPPSKPSGHVSTLDPATERAILRCLERDPKDRPAAALAVAAALPGGDPLAAALAAGETPSPKLVADAGGEGAIRPWVGLALLGVVVAGIVLAALLADRVMLFRRVPLPESPTVLARRAQQLLERLGYPDAPVDTAFHFRVNAESIRRTLKEDQSPHRWDNLTEVRPTPLYFFYRQSPQPLAPTLLDTGELENLLVTDDNPPTTLPGMAGAHLDPNGRLLRLYVLPPQQTNLPPTPAEPDWGRWFDPATIGFDLTRDLQAVPPEWTPPCACDRQAAWTGTLPGRPDWPVRVEAAAYRGRPVWFEVMPLWRKAEPREGPYGGFFRPRDVIPGPVAIGLLVSAVVVLLAVRNLRRGRADVRGAVRLGLAILTVTAGAWLFGGHHTLSQEGVQIIMVLGYGGCFAFLYGASYLALEPAVRRRWPWRITAWNRLLAGRLGDPMVGRDLLIGLAFGAAVLLVPRAALLSAEWAGVPPPPPLTGTGPFALHVPGPPTPLYVLLSILYIPIIIPVGILTQCFLFFLVLRREWLAWGVVYLFGLVGWMLPHLGPSPAGNVLTFLWAGLSTGLWIFALYRFGLLATAAALFCSELLALVPLTADLSAWYAYQGVLMALVVLGLAVYAYFTATRGQRLFREGFFGDE